MQNTQKKRKPILQRCRLCQEPEDSIFISQSKDLCLKHSNSQSNTIIPKLCPHCEVPLAKEEFEEHCLKCPERIIKCQYCGCGVMACLHQFHLQECEANENRPQYVVNQKVLRAQKIDAEGEGFFKDACIWCQAEIGKGDQPSHLERCKVNHQIKQELWEYELTPNEFQLIYSLHKQSALAHLQARQLVLAKTEHFGYSLDDLALMSEFIQHQAPLIIHFDFERDISDFNSDFKYRTLFEVNKSGGNKSFQKRVEWEEHLFGSFSREMRPHERVKYGVLNYSNDKLGMARCRSYGQSIILLKPSVRRRCTIAHRRKYAQGQTVATLKYHYPVLQKYSSQEMSALHLASRGFEVESHELQSFKEIHVHGPIRFQTDVECIYTYKYQLHKCSYQAKIFQEKFGVSIIAIDEVESPGPQK